MFAHLIALFQARRSTKFLLARSDDRLLADIGLCRADIEAMHLGLGVQGARGTSAGLSNLPFAIRLPA